MLTTASLAVSKQMLHSNIESSFFELFSFASDCLLEESCFVWLAASKSFVVAFIESVLIESDVCFADDELSVDCLFKSLAKLFEQFNGFDVNKLDDEDEAALGVSDVSSVDDIFTFSPFYCPIC